MELQTVKTSEVIGAALDWAVAKCEGYKSKPSTYVQGRPFCYYIRGEYGGCESFLPSTHWDFGGPIIEREGIGFLFDAGSACRKASWFATPDDQCTTTSYEGEYFDPAFMVDEESGIRGNTPLIAAMRCYVKSKLGAYVDVPKELLVNA